MPTLPGPRVLAPFHRSRRAVALAALLGLVFAAWADEPAMQLVVSQKSPVTSLSKSKAAALFLKKSTTYDDGSPAEPIDQVESSPARVVFSEQVLRKSVRAVKSYWQQRVFQGIAVPPPEKATDAEVMAAVAANPRAIGYVQAGTKLAGVRAITVTE